VAACALCSGAGGGRRQPARSAERLRPSGERGSGWMEKKKWVVAGLKGRMGRLAAGPIGPKVKEKLFFK
jgi:hypothetical protein